MLVRRMPYRGKHPIGVYRRHSVKHVAQAVMLVVPATVALWTHTILVPLLLLVGGQMALLTVLPRLGSFRRAVDERLATLARAEAAATREFLVGRMSDEHRRELEHLERLAGQINAKSARSRGEEALEAEEWLGLGRLFAAFVKLAIAHRESVEAFRCINRSDLDEHATRLEAMLHASHGPSRLWIERRLSIARRRVEAWDHALSERAVMAHGIAMIGELVRWMHEQCVTSPTEAVRLDIEEIVAAWEQDGATLKALSTICARFEPGEVEVFGSTAVEVDSLPPRSAAALAAVPTSSEGASAA